jgi:hypothetical protein
MTHKTRAEEFWMDKVAALGCVICRIRLDTYSPAQLHHVAEGSGLRSNFAVVPLCHEHHQGATGFHTLGKGFLKTFRVPGESEYGLLVLTNELLAKEF